MKEPTVAFSRLDWTGRYTYQSASEESTDPLASELANLSATMMQTTEE
jgi:hypothetical protein